MLRTVTRDKAVLLRNCKKSWCQQMSAFSKMIFVILVSVISTSLIINLTSVVSKVVR